MDFITVTIYFKINDAELYGGKGSTGYAAMGIGFDTIEKISKLNEDFISGGIKAFSEQLGVSKDKITSISRTEYDRETEGDDDCDGEDDDY